MLASPYQYPMINQSNQFGGFRIAKTKKCVFFHQSTWETPVAFMLLLNCLRCKNNKETFSFSIWGSGGLGFPAWCDPADQALALSGVTDRWGWPHLWRLGPRRLITITRHVMGGMRPPHSPQVVATRPPLVFNFLCFLSLFVSSLLVKFNAESEHKVHADR